MEKAERIIKQFKIDKKQQAFVHPFMRNKIKSESTSQINIYLITIGHLWIYRLIEKYGYGKFLNELILYSMKNKNSLIEWELNNASIDEIKTILSKYDIEFVCLVTPSLDIFEYKEILSSSKNKAHPYHRLTRLLFLLKYQKVNQIIGDLDLNTDMHKKIEDIGSIINAAYLGLEFSGEIIVEIPEILINIFQKNVHCKAENTKIKYYPNLVKFAERIPTEIEQFSSNWYTLSEEEQVIISKLLYSLRILYEISFTLPGSNGILSTFVTRTLFDNFWQSKYLIENNEISKYREFTMDRMRLHILKRTDRNDISNIDELMLEVNGGIIDPIPIHGDYFNKSAREYAIALGIKEDYDKYYEYNSEFIHASLTAVYSALMVKCENPEHNNHLTLSTEISKYIDSMKHIFEILNMHISLINDYFNHILIEPYNFDDLLFKDRKEFIEKMRMDK